MGKFLSILHSLFIRPIEILIGIGSLIMRFFLISPLFIIQNLITVAIIIWIYGQIVALVTAHQFLPASYFDFSKYPIYLQEVLNAKMSFAGMCNWYIISYFWVRGSDMVSWNIVGKAQRNAVIATYGSVNPNTSYFYKT